VAFQLSFVQFLPTLVHSVFCATILTLPPASVQP